MEDQMYSRTPLDNEFERMQASIAGLRTTMDSLAVERDRIALAARELADAVTCRPGCKANGGDECTCGLEKLTTAVYDATKRP